MLKLRFVTCAAFILVSAAGLRAQELSLSGGALSTHRAGDSYAWLLSYRQPLDSAWSWSYAWYNEGHVSGHHRDGPLLQFWGGLPLGRDFRLSAGAGPFAYFDTEAARKGASFRDSHGWGLVFSLNAAWNFSRHWNLQLTGNRMTARNDISESSLLAGVGYRLSGEPEGEGWLDGDNEITVFLGQTVLNTLNSQSSVAKSVEYRRGLFPYIEGSVSWIRECDNRLLRRNGVAAQLWPHREFLNSRFSVAAGFGAYVPIDSYTGSNTDRSRTSGLVSMSLAAQVWKGLTLRTIWHRTVTNYSRDTDIMLAGAGWKF